MTAETSRQQGRDIVAPAGDRPARVLGQARTEAEYEAFVALKSALGPLGKAESAQDFLERFPLSGLSPFAHQVAATAYHQLNDYDSFIHHAERALLEVPHDPLLQTRLAVAYAQSHQTRKAVGQARRGLKTIETLRRPPKVSEEEWNSQLMRFRADANYALGTAYLEDFSNFRRGIHRSRSEGSSGISRTGHPPGPTPRRGSFSSGFCIPETEPGGQGHPELRARGGPGRFYVVAGPSASRKDLQAPPPSPTG